VKAITTRAILPFSLLVGLTAAIAACNSGDGEEPTYDECYVERTGADGETVRELDCSLPGCESTPVCSRGCKAQSECGTVRTDLEVDRICEAGNCATTGPRTDEGKLRTGGTYVWHTFDKNVNVSIIEGKGYLLTVHHAVRPDGKALTCRDLLRLDDPDAETNVLSRTHGEVRDIDSGQLMLARIEKVPLVEGDKPHLLLSRFYSVSPRAPENNTGEPGGLLYARGCVEELEVIEGPLPDQQDEAYTVNLTVSPACDTRDPNACPDGKECVAGAGFCRYVCEENCSRRETCRPLREGEPPQCVYSCDPDRGVACPLDERNTPRCDVTPGEDPACLPDD